MEELLFEEHEATLKSDTPSSSGRNSPSTSGGGTKKTEAERRFEETKKQRVCHLPPPDYASNAHLVVSACTEGCEIGRNDAQGSCRRVQQPLGVLERAP